MALNHNLGCGTATGNTTTNSKDTKVHVLRAFTLSQILSAFHPNSLF